MAIRKLTQKRMVGF